MLYVLYPELYILARENKFSIENSPPKKKRTHKIFALIYSLCTRPLHNFTSSSNNSNFVCVSNTLLLPQLFTTTTPVNVTQWPQTNPPVTTQKSPLPISNSLIQSCTKRDSTNSNSGLFTESSRRKGLPPSLSKVFFRLSKRDLISSKKMTR